MINYDGRTVIASDHAVEQALKRIAVNKGATLAGVALWVERTAARGLRDGRRAKRCPRWAARDGRRPRIGNRWGGKARYVWNETETALLVVQRVRGRYVVDGSRVWLVLTVMSRVWVDGPDWDER